MIITITTTTAITTTITIEFFQWEQSCGRHACTPKAVTAIFLEPHVM